MHYLVASFLLINAVHIYLLAAHRANRNLTISERAAKNNAALALYVAGHLINGALFAIFAYSFFLHKSSEPLLFAVAALGVISEWSQALIPARGEYDKPHTMIAYLMSALMTLLGAMSAILLPASSNVQRLILAITFIILWGYPLAAVLPRRYFWVIEMVNINLFYLQMFILIQLV